MREELSLLLCTDETQRPHVFNNLPTLPDLEGYRTGLESRSLASKPNLLPTPL